MAVLLKLGVFCSGQGARGEVSWPSKVLDAARSRGEEEVRARPPVGGTSQEGISSCALEAPMRTQR